MTLHTVNDQLSLFVEQAEALEPEVRVSRSDPPLPLLSGSSQTAQALARQLPGNRVSVVSPTIQSRTEAASEIANGSLESEWSCFVREHGRIPRIEDNRKPWEYRGWLLYYRLLLEQHPGIGRRWDYWYRTMSAGHLLNSPIPQICFWDRADPQAFRQIDRWIRLLDRHIGGWASIGTLLDWLLWGFASSQQPPRLSAELNEALYREVDLAPMLLKPYDYFGEWIQMQKGDWNPTGFYPTPHPVVEFMVRMTIEEGGEDRRAKKVLDPCVGSGRMLMHASNFSLRLYGVDIDPTMVKLTCVNGALYVPWLLRPFPETFFPSSPVEPESSTREPAALEATR